MVSVRKSLLLGSAIYCMFSGVAFAQTAEPASTGLGDIVVTAEKRESTVQKTPIAMSALNAEMIKSNHVASLTDLAGLAPSLAIAQNSTATIITIRGVSSRDTTEIGDPAVAVSMNGFYYQRPFALNDTVYDLERAEVLRGPQGTLYGRNATGGAINFISAKPKNELSGSTTVGYGNYNALEVQGYMNIPVVSDKIETRISYFLNKHDGYRTNNYSSGADGDDADSKSVRLSVLLKPIDRLKINLLAQYTTSGGVGPTFYGVSTGGTINNNVQPSVDSKGSEMGSPRQSTDIKGKSIQLDATYDLDFATLTYVGGYRKQTLKQNRDLDGVSKSDAYFIQDESPADWQHELRIASAGNSRFKWQLGAFYFHEKNSLTNNFVTYESSIAPGQALSRFIYVYPKIIAKSEAGFGQASYDITNTITAEAGIRYSWDYKSRVGYSNQTNAAYTGVGNIYTDAHTSSSKWTTHFGLNWQATPANLLYVKRDTGYKAGGFQDVAGVGSVAYGPESLTSYEIGSKNRFMDNKIQLNASAYIYDYKDQQISQFQNGYTAVYNAGKSRIWGIELEGAYQITPEDRFDGYVGYLHARFRNFLVSGIQYAGNSPPQSPTWQINAGYQHDFLLGNGGKITPRIQTHYESSSYLGYQNYALQKVDRYTRSDAMLTYIAPNDKLTLQAYVKNLENSTVLTYAQANSLWSTYNFMFAPPRTYGVRLTYNY